MDRKSDAPVELTPDQMSKVSGGVNNGEVTNLYNTPSVGDGGFIDADVADATLIAGFVAEDNSN